MTKEERTAPLSEQELTGVNGGQTEERREMVIRLIRITNEKANAYPPNVLEMILNTFEKVGSAAGMRLAKKMAQKNKRADALMPFLEQL